MSAIYDPCCTADTLPVAAGITDEQLDELIDKVTRKVWREKGVTNNLSDDLIKYFAEQIWEAVIDGYGMDLGDIDVKTVDKVMLQKLQENVWHFASAKTYQQMVALSKELLDENGNRRTWSQFKKAAFSVNNEHVGHWLQAEYNLAQVSAQAAAKWVTIQENKDDLPLLKFSAIIDDNTTDICRNFDGIVLPEDHWFWDQYFIPNHFGERSDILQTAYEDITDIKTVVFPDKIPVMFRTNLAKNGQVFPEGHPYYNGNSPEVKTKADALRRKYGK